MRYQILLLCSLMTLAAGCSAPTSTSLDLGLGSLTPYHCVDDHYPFHCPIQNFTAELQAGNAHANLSVENAAEEPPYVLGEPTMVSVELAHDAPEGSTHANVTFAVEPTAGMKLPLNANQTFELAPGESEEMTVVISPVEGWPAGDFIFPRLAFGVDGEWTAKHLVFVIPGEQENVGQGDAAIPVGLLALAALAAAAVLALPRRRP